MAIANPISKKVLNFDENDATNGITGSDIKAASGESQSIADVLADTIAKEPTFTDGAIATWNDDGFLDDSETLVSDLEAVANKGAASGYCPLDASSKVSTTYLPDAVIGALNYQGTWDADTNDPSLASGVGTKGYYYVVSVAGTTTLDGISDWQIGDWVVFNGTAWEKIDNTDKVSSVNSQTGVVVLDTEDVAASGDNQYYTPSASSANEKTANKGAANGYCPLGADQKVPSANLPASAGSATACFHHKVTAGEISAKTIDFSEINNGDEPGDATNFKAGYYGVPLVMGGVDATLTPGAGATMTWNGLGLDGVIAADEYISFTFKIN